MSQTLSKGESAMLLELLNSIKERLLDHDLNSAAQHLEEAIASIPYLGEPE